VHLLLAAQIDDARNVFKSPDHGVEAHLQYIRYFCRRQIQSPSLTAIGRGRALFSRNSSPCFSVFASQRHRRAAHKKTNALPGGRRRLAVGAVRAACVCVHRSEAKSLEEKRTVQAQVLGRKGRSDGVLQCGWLLRVFSGRQWMNLSRGGANSCRRRG
jgi:hypothetical protein